MSIPAQIEPPVRCMYRSNSDTVSEIFGHLELKKLTPTLKIELFVSY